jgi:uncharacterized protein (DUF1330 family)
MQRQLTTTERHSDHSGDAPPLTLVVVEYGGRADPAPEDGSFAGIVAGFGGTLLIDSVKPMRVYEYVIPIPSRLIVARWRDPAAIRAFVASEIFDSRVRSRLGRNRAIVIYEPAFDWDPTLTGVWIEPGAPPRLSLGPVYHTTISDCLVPGKLPYAEAAGSVLRFCRRWGGIPIITRSPAEILEGEWADNRHLLITSWPCREAFEAWYLEDEYQQNVKPRRLVCGRFSLMMFPDASLNP